ncbi:hypothetical protein GCM10010472_34060 [Pseudonocardia halophobica]
MAEHPEPKQEPERLGSGLLVVKDPQRGGEIPNATTAVSVSFDVAEEHHHPPAGADEPSTSSGWSKRRAIRSAFSTAAPPAATLIRRPAWICPRRPRSGKDTGSPQQEQTRSGRGREVAPPRPIYSNLMKLHRPCDIR